MGSNTPRTLTAHHVGHLCRIRLKMKKGPNDDGWAEEAALLGRELLTIALAHQPHVRNITDTRGSPAAASIRGWIPETVWSFCSSWRLTCSKVKWNSIRTPSAALLSGFSQRSSAQPLQDGHIFRRQNRGMKGKSQAGQNVYKWASDVASAGIAAGPKGPRHQFIRLEKVTSIIRLCSPLSPSSPLSRCLEEVQQHRTQHRITRGEVGGEQGRRRGEEAVGGSALAWSLSHSAAVKAGMTRLELATATKV